MDALLARDFVYGANRDNEALVARYLREGRGLERAAAYDALDWAHEPRTRLIEAASEAVLTDSSSAVGCACLYLSRCRNDEAVRKTLHRAARESVNVNARLCIIAETLSGDRRDDEARILYSLLDDPEECIRVAAAAVLGGTYYDPVGFRVLVAYLRQPLGQVFARHHWLWLAERVWRAFCTLGDERARWALGRARAHVEGFCVGLVLDFPDCPPLDAEAWEAWWAEHKSEYPAQLDPDAMDVGPIRPRAR